MTAFSTDWVFVFSLASISAILLSDWLAMSSDGISISSEWIGMSSDGIAMSSDRLAISSDALAIPIARIASKNRLASIIPFFFSFIKPLFLI